MTADIELLRPVEPAAMVASRKEERRRQEENVALNHLDTQVRIQRRAYRHHADRGVWLAAAGAELARAAERLEQIARDWA